MWWHWTPWNSTLPNRLAPKSVYGHASSRRSGTGRPPFPKTPSYTVVTPFPPLSSSKQPDRTMRRTPQSTHKPFEVPATTSGRPDFEKLIRNRCRHGKCGTDSNGGKAGQPMAKATSPHLHMFDVTLSQPGAVWGSRRGWPSLSAWLSHSNNNTFETTDFRIFPEKMYLKKSLWSLYVDKLHTDKPVINISTCAYIDLYMAVNVSKCTTYVLHWVTWWPTWEWYTTYNI